MILGHVEERKERYVEEIHGGGGTRLMIVRHVDERREKCEEEILGDRNQAHDRGTCGGKKGEMCGGNSDQTHDH